MVLSSGTSEFKSSGVTTTPGGSEHDIQYNGGSDGFSGNGSLTFNDVTKQLTLNGSMTINGNLKINGSYTELHFEHLTIKDKLFAMNASDTQHNSASNSGIIIYDVPNASNVFFGLNNDRVFAIATASGVTANDNTTTLDNNSLKYDIDLRGNNASFTNISASGVITGNVTGSAGSCTGNAATATSLATSRGIGGVPFNGTGDINLPGVNQSGNQDTTGNAETATTAVNISVNNESSNTSCFVLFTTDHATKSKPNSNASFTFNPSTAALTITSLGVGVDATGNPGEIRATNDITAFYSSDKRIKENIKKIENPLDKLENINGYTFDWIEKEGIHSNKGHDIGVIAQEIEEVLPEVTTTRDNGYKAVRYEKIVPLLIECIKEQQKQIDELKDEINLLKNK